MRRSSCDGLFGWIARQAAVFPAPYTPDMTAAGRRGRGRPPVGERVAVRLPPDLLRRLDAESARQGRSRAATVRRLLDDALARSEIDGVDRAQLRRQLGLSPVERIRRMAAVANRNAALRARRRPSA
jgi:hypothetical protein